MEKIDFLFEQAKQKINQYVSQSESVSNEEIHNSINKFERDIECYLEEYRDTEQIIPQLREQFLELEQKMLEVNINNIHQMLDIRTKVVRII